MRILITCMVMCSFVYHGNAQDSTNKKVKNFKNTIKFNVTSKVLYDNSYQFSYERLTRKNQSFSIYGGYIEFPGALSLNIENTQFSKASSKSGYALGMDYRFYLMKENKFGPPHGIYLAPFINYYKFKSERTLTYTDSLGNDESTKMHTGIGFLNIGAELGYQFVLGKRWVIDAVIFGPAVTHYNFKVSMDDKLPGLDENGTIKQVIDALKEKYPVLKDLSSNQSVSGNGVEDFWSFGFRYCISVGFRF